MKDFYFDLFSFVEEIPSISRREIVEVTRETLVELEINKATLTFPDIIIDYIEFSCEGDITEMLEMQQEVEELYKCGTIEVELLRDLEDYCENWSLCNQCGSDLQCEYGNEEREYFGSNTYERMSEWYCPDGCVLN